MLCKGEGNSKCDIVDFGLLYNILPVTRNLYLWSYRKGGRQRKPSRKVGGNGNGKNVQLLGVWGGLGKYNTYVEVWKQKPLLLCLHPLSVNEGVKEVVIKDHI